MKETIRSLQWYFVLVAVIAGYSGVRGILDLPEGMDTMRMLAMAKVAAAALFLVVGLALRPLLTKAPMVVIGLIVLNALASIAIVALQAMNAKKVFQEKWLDAFGWMPFLQTAVMIAICVYLIVNVRRLAADLRGARAS